VDDFFHLVDACLLLSASAAANGPSRRKDHEVDTQQRLKFNEDNIAEFRASGGRIASFGNAPLLLLTTAGARSGQRRTSPMMYLADEQHPDRVYVFASAAGDDQHPAWFHNVVAHPADLEVELGDARYQATAEVVPSLDELRSTPHRRSLPRLCRIPGHDITGHPSGRARPAAMRALSTPSRTVRPIWDHRTHMPPKMRSRP